MSSTTFRPNFKPYLRLRFEKSDRGEMGNGFHNMTDDDEQWDSAWSIQFFASDLDNTRFHTSSVEEECSRCRRKRLHG